MDKDFIAYVFRPLRTILAGIALLGIIGGISGCWVILIAVVGRTINDAVFWLINPRRIRKQEPMHEQITSQEKSKE